MFDRTLAHLHRFGSRALFAGTHLYAIGFVARCLASPAGGPPPAADTVDLIVDLALLLGCAIQYGVLRRRGRSDPEPMQRDAQFIAASRALIALLVFWQPLPAAQVFGFAAAIAILAVVVIAIVIASRPATRDASLACRDDGH